MTPVVYQRHLRRRRDAADVATSRSHLALRRHLRARRRRQQPRGLHRAAAADPCCCRDLLQRLETKTETFSVRVLGYDIHIT